VPQGILLLCVPAPTTFADSEDVEALCELHAHLKAAKSNEKKTVELDTKFHSRIAAAGKNRALVLAREPIALLLHQGFTQVAGCVPQAASRQIEAHDYILDGIRAGDVDKAREWARRHIEDFWRGIRLAGLEDQPCHRQPQIN